MHGRESKGKNTHITTTITPIQGASRVLLSYQTKEADTLKIPDDNYEIKTPEQIGKHTTINLHSSKPSTTSKDRSKHNTTQKVQEIAIPSISTIGWSTLILSNAMAAANLADEDRNCTLRESPATPTLRPRTPGTTSVEEEPAEKQATEEADRSHDREMENLCG